MPDLTFVLPHWLYWSGLVFFPLIAMVMVRRYRAAEHRKVLSLPIGYMLLVTAGFVGLHRFYLRSWLGAVYLPLFIGILIANVQTRDLREAQSLAGNDVMIAEFDLERAQQAVDDGDEGAAEKLAEAERIMAEAEASVADTEAASARWASIAMWLAIAIAVLLVIDAVLLPRLVRAREPLEVAEPAAPSDDHSATSATGLAGLLQRISTFSGEYVAYWSVIAVFAYYYEVVARYIFNSPTNWVHESMFLMFGMQYLICGAYAYMTDSHVRVDVFYARLSDRGKALTDLLTSVFFFIFAGTMLWTGYIFLSDAVGVWEVSFTEWAIQYWPVKATIALGAVLIILQGIAKMLSDIHVLATAE